MKAHDGSNRNTVQKYKKLSCRTVNKTYFSFLTMVNTETDREFQSFQISDRATLPLTEYFA